MTVYSEHGLNVLFELKVVIFYVIISRELLVGALSTSHSICDEKWTMGDKLLFV